MLTADAVRSLRVGLRASTTALLRSPRGRTRTCHSSLSPGEPLGTAKLAQTDRLVVNAVDVRQRLDQRLAHAASLLGARKALRFAVPDDVAVELPHQGERTADDVGILCRRDGRRNRDLAVLLSDSDTYNNPGYNWRCMRLPNSESYTIVVRGLSVLYGACVR